jgi:hypothetical protein
LGQKRGKTGLIQFQKVKASKLAMAQYFRRHMTLAERCFCNIPGATK